jgi:hypothetical protein
LYEHIARHPRDCRIEEIRSLLTAAGYTARPLRGSIEVYVRPGMPSITIPTYRPLLQEQLVRAVLDAIDAL